MLELFMLPAVPPPCCAVAQMLTIDAVHADAAVAGPAVRASSLSAEPRLRKAKIVYVILAWSLVSRTQACGSMCLPAYDTMRARGC